MSLSSLFVLFFISMMSVVMSQTDLMVDPGLETLDSEGCASDRPWYFRADFLWNATSEFFDSDVAANLEIPTPPIPGFTKGRQTNINKAPIPEFPTVFGALTYDESAGVVDMNTPARAALWAPFQIVNTSSDVTVSLQLWVRSNEGITQVELDDSDIPGADLLQYLPDPDGLLRTTQTFPPIREETNMFRIDILRPEDEDATNPSFFNRAFSQISEHIAMNIPIPDWERGMLTPPEGTEDEWIEIEADISEAVDTPGWYALRIASAQSRVGVSWGVTDVHVMSEGGIPPDDFVPEPVVADVIIDRTSKTIGGTAVFSKVTTARK